MPRESPSPDRSASHRVETINGEARRRGERDGRGRERSPHRNDDDDRERARNRRSRRPDEDRDAHARRAYKDDERPADRGGIRYKNDPRSRPKSRTDNGASASRPDVRDRDGAGGHEKKKDKKEKEKEKENKKDAAAQRPAELMIRVTVNDRLGTKAQIPCYASDNIGDLLPRLQPSLPQCPPREGRSAAYCWAGLFKKQVAARIGRPSETIMLKRQGERPFKDHLTLDDYGVSDGVQLDL